MVLGQYKGIDHIIDMDKGPPRAYFRAMTDAPKVRYLDRATPPHISTLILLAGLGATPRRLGWRRTAWSFVGRYV